MQRRTLNLNIQNGGRELTCVSVRHFSSELLIQKQDNFICVNRIWDDAASCPKNTFLTVCFNSPRHDLLLPA